VVGIALASSGQKRPLKKKNLLEFRVDPGEHSLQGSAKIGQRKWLRRRMG
jgi:hypothetical protein